MKILLFFAFWILHTSSWSQISYNSNKTIHVSSQITEHIFREITFSKGKEFILINSFPEFEPEHNQLLVVQNFHKKIEPDGTYKVFSCSSADGVFPTLILVREKNPEYILVLQPSITSNAIEELHLVLENIP